MTIQIEPIKKIYANKWYIWQAFVTKGIGDCRILLRMVIFWDGWQSYNCFRSLLNSFVLFLATGISQSIPDNFKRYPRVLPFLEMIFFMFTINALWVRMMYGVFDSCCSILLMELRMTTFCNFSSRYRWKTT